MKRKIPLSTTQANAKTRAANKRMYESVYKAYVKYSPGKRGGGIKKLETLSKDKPGKRLKYMTAAEKGKIIVNAIAPLLHKPKDTKKTIFPEKQAALEVKGSIRTWKNTKKLVEDLQQVKRTSRSKRGTTPEHRKQALQRSKTLAKLKPIYVKVAGKVFMDYLNKQANTSMWGDIKEDFVMFISDTKIWADMNRVLDNMGLQGKSRQAAKQAVYEKLTESTER